MDAALFPIKRLSRAAIRKPNEWSPTVRGPVHQMNTLTSSPVRLDATAYGPGANAMRRRIRCDANRTHAPAGR